MATSAEKTDPKLWDEVKAKVTRSSKGGKPGQWSARKAQAATRAYKEAGGGYEGAKSVDNSLKRWSDEDYARSTRKKRADTAKGRPFSRQPADVAKATSAARKRGGGATKAELMRKARAKGIPGRSTMTKAALEKALAGA